MFLRLLATTFILFSFSIYAVEPSEQMKFGRLQIEPRVFISILDNDNLFESATDKVNAVLTEFVPSVKARYLGVLVDTNIAYSLNSGRYNDFSTDDYDDHIFRSSLSYQVTRRSRIKVDLDYMSKHIARSTNTLDFDAIRPPNEYDETNAEFNYTFGRKKAKGMVEIFSQYTEREFTNNRFNTLDKDRELILFGGRFQLRLNPRASAFVELSREELNYLFDPVSVINSIDTLDSERDQYYAGFRWGITAKSEGQLKLGYINKTFVDKDREDFSTLSWQANVKFNISPQSNLRFVTSKGDKESDQGISGGFIDQESFSLLYQKKWGNDFSSTISTRVINKEYIDYTEEREEVLTSFGLRLDYSIQKWIDIGVSVDVENNDAEATTSNYDYDRTKFSFHLTAGL